MSVHRQEALDIRVKAHGEPGCTKMEMGKGPERVRQSTNPRIIYTPPTAWEVVGAGPQ